MAREGVKKKTKKTPQRRKYQCGGYLFLTSVDYPPPPQKNNTNNSFVTMICRKVIKKKSKKKKIRVGRHLVHGAFGRREAFAWFGSLPGGGSSGLFDCFVTRAEEDAFDSVGDSVAVATWVVTCLFVIFSVINSTAENHNMNANRNFSKPIALII